MNNLQFKISGEIFGAKRFKGNFDGTDIDYTKVFVATPLDGSSGDAVGLSISEYRFGTSENFYRFRECKFPFKADLLVEMTTNGKTQKLNLIDFYAQTEKKTA